MSRRRRPLFLAGALALCLMLAGAFLSWRARVRHTQAGVGLHALAADVPQYAEDHANALPPMRDPTAFRAALWPCTKSQAAFHAFDNSTRKLLPNSNLSGKKLSAIKTLTVLLYESEPSPADGSRWVAFLPENAVPSAVAGDPDFAGLKLVPEAEWRTLRTVSGIR